MSKIHNPPLLPPSDILRYFLQLSLALPGNPELQEFMDENTKTQYYHWDKFRRLPIPDWYTHEELWWVLKEIRSQNEMTVYLGKYKFTFQVPNFLMRRLHYIDLHLGWSLGGKGIIPKGDELKYLHSSLIEEAIASSQIEGAATTRDIAKEMILSNRKPKTPGERMIFNNFLAMQYISKHKDKTIEIEDILNLHQILTDQTLDNVADEWRFRIENNIHVVDTATGETLHTPVPYAEIPWLMQELIRFMNTESEETFIHPVVKGIIIHFLVGWIHPFADGNGRTARGLFYWYIVKNGYWLTEYISISRVIKRSTVKYKNSYLYTETDNNDLTYFLDYNTSCVIDGLEDFREYIYRQIEKQNAIKNELMVEGMNYRQVKILAWILEDKKVVTIPQVTNMFLTSRNTSRLDLEWLVALWKLQKVAIDRKTNGYTIQ